MDTLWKNNSLARDFYLKNPTPPGAAQATSLGSISNTGNPTPPANKEGQGKSTEASKATRSLANAGAAVWETLSSSD